MVAEVMKPKKLLDWKKVEAEKLNVLNSSRGTTWPRSCAGGNNASDFQISVPDLRKGFNRQPLDCSLVRLEFYINLTKKRAAHEHS